MLGRPSGRRAWRALISGLLALGAGLLVSCANDRPRPLRPSDDLFDPDPGRRVQAVSEVRRLRATEHVPALIEMLDDPDETVRLLAGTTLPELTGRRSGYAGFAWPEERRRQVEDWRRWWGEQPARAASAPRAGGPR